MRKNISSGSPYEEPIGFSRAVRIGNRICVSGTAPIAKDGSVESPGDVYRQTKRCLEIIKQAIEEAGGSLAEVIRTRVYLTNAETWKEAAKAHGEFFSSIKPACTFVEVSRLIDPLWLVEIEAECEMEM
ncbi:MAG: RidA family protein [Candidatus Aminicenantes bacterium]|jgi:enamine deaminase RidA (YjgF/YER057c/UK114 family)